MESFNEIDDFVKDYKNFEERLTRLYGLKHGTTFPQESVVSLFNVYLKNKHIYQK